MKQCIQKLLLEEINRKLKTLGKAVLKKRINLTTQLKKSRKRILKFVKKQKGL